MSGTPATGRALILAGGDLRVDRRLREAVAGHRPVIAADGGLRHAQTLGVRPDLLVGDLDSVTDADLARWPDLRVERHPPDKDALDLELALDAAAREGARGADVVGAFGGRLDQTLSAVGIAVRTLREGLPVALLDARHQVHPLVADARAPDAVFEPDLPDGTVFSLMPVDGPARVDVRGADFPLDDGALPPGRGLGLSNRARGGPVVRVREGAVLFVVEWDEGAPDAERPVDALWGEDAERIRSGLRATSADLAELVEEVAYDRVFARPGLDHRTRALLAIAQLVHVGSPDEIRTHVRALLRNGGTLEQAHEAIVHAAMFAGFPRALAAMRAWAAERDRDPNRRANGGDLDPSAG
ncbi:MAG: thiamine diphosphokinase [Trueperaceae bacterium]